HRRDEDVGAAELHIDARLAFLHAAQDLGAEHAFEPLGGRLRVRTAYMDMIPRVLGHWFAPYRVGAKATSCSATMPTESCGRPPRDCCHCGLSYARQVTASTPASCSRSRASIHAAAAR